MRHRVYGKHLGRNKNERQALFKGLVYSLFSYGTIQTSETKAKAIKGLVDKIINSARSKNTQGQIQPFLSNKVLVDRLVKDILPKLGARTSGYTKMVKIGTRLGDQTRVVKMSLIGAEELKPVVKEKVTSNKAQETSKKEEKKEISSEKKARTGRSVRTTVLRKRVTSRSSK